MKFISKSILRKVYVKRDKWAHKGHYGKLLVVAGSEIMTGSPTLIGMAALNSSVDTVYFVGPRRAMDITASNFPTFITKPLDGDYVADHHLRTIFSFANDMQISGLAIGPGLWRNPDVRKTVVKIVSGFEVPMVIDADAIRALSGNPYVLAGKTAVITPHADEFRELTGVKVSTDLKERAIDVKEQARKLRTVILLKGHVDVISDGKNVAFNRTGNVFMSKGGTGDTLTGICAALISRKRDKVDPFVAACAAAYINGRAGDLAASGKNVSLLPTDLIENIKQAIK